MSLSELSVLSAETAISFHEMDLELLKEVQNGKGFVEHVAPPVQQALEEEPIVFVSVDDQNLANDHDGASFVFEKLRFFVQQVIQNGTRHVYLSITATTPAEWHLLVQLRIKTGTESHVLNVVDKDVFKFDAFSYPLNVEVQTPDVKFLKFEMRVLTHVSHLKVDLFSISLSSFISNFQRSLTETKRSSSRMVPASKSTRTFSRFCPNSWANPRKKRLSVPTVQ